ncbi:hypothetical protein AB0392_30100 [Nonomuraea angiospora]|uniref:hypothetical protein n=1 Tax=Nonomuraea angiospora TaxID=46172 RepID=UPI00344C7032
MRWDAVKAATVVDDTADNLVINQKGAARELYPFHLRSEPELQALVNAVDITERTARSCLTRSAGTGSVVCHSQPF